MYSSTYHTLCQLIGHLLQLIEYQSIFGQYSLKESSKFRGLNFRFLRLAVTFAVTFWGYKNP